MKTRPTTQMLKAIPAADIPPKIQNTSTTSNGKKLGKMKTHSLLLCTVGIAGTLLISLQNNRAAIYMEDSFDGSPYTDNATFVTGTGKLAHGYWWMNNGGNYSVTTSTAESFSANRSLLLKTGSGSSNYAGVAGAYSLNGTTDSAPLTIAHEVRFSFLVDDTTINGITWALVRGNDSGGGTDKNFGNVVIYGNQFGINLRAGNNAYVTGNLSVDTWYHVKMAMPELGSGDPTYTVTLYNADYTEIGSVSGVSKNANMVDYRYFTFINNGSTDKAIYFDNVSVVPEPSSLALLSLGLGVIQIFRRKRRY